MQQIENCTMSKYSEQSCEQEIEISLMDSELERAAFKMTHISTKLLLVHIQIEELIHLHLT